MLKYLTVGTKISECAKNVETGLKLIQSFKDMGITFGNVLSYNALLDICSLAANLQTPGAERERERERERESSYLAPSPLTFKPQVPRDV